MPAITTTRIARAIGARVQDIRANVLLNPSALLARLNDKHPVGENLWHLRAALAWLERAQDATPDDGFSRGFSLTYNPYFKGRGWQASYPETTGYIIPTLYSAAQYLGDESWAERATRAAYWEIELQLENGAVQGGVVGQRRSPAIFNTGQVIFGWLAALQHTQDSAFERATRRAADFLTSVESDGSWSQGNSQFARKDATAYNARAAWALAEAGVVLREQHYLDAAERILLKVAHSQSGNGWFPDCCLNDPDRPLLHTIAYTIRGLLEGGRVLGNEALWQAGTHAASALLSRVNNEGWMPGRFAADWSAAAGWSCLTGQAQMANNWMRLFEIDGDRKWLKPVPGVMRFLKQHQSLTTPIDGLRGGLPGSAPLSGEYGRYEVLNWATKYLADALMRDHMIAVGAPHRVTHLA